MILILIGILIYIVVHAYIAVIVILFVRHSLSESWNEGYRVGLEEDRGYSYKKSVFDKKGKNYSVEIRERGSAQTSKE